MTITRQRRYEHDAHQLYLKILGFELNRTMPGISSLPVNRSPRDTGEALAFTRDGPSTPDVFVDGDVL